jgi:hypothetical protein
MPAFAEQETMMIAAARYGMATRFLDRRHNWTGFDDARHTHHTLKHGAFGCHGKLAYDVYKGDFDVDSLVQPFLGKIEHGLSGLYESCKKACASQPGYPEDLYFHPDGGIEPWGLFMRYYIRDGQLIIHDTRPNWDLRMEPLRPIGHGAWEGAGRVLVPVDAATMGLVQLPRPRSQLILGIPTLNQYDRCRACITSALAGDVQPDAVIVVDNGGSFTDDRVRVLKPGRNLGVAASWNLLRRTAGRDRLLLSNDDVIFKPNALRRLTEEIDAGYQIVALCGAACWLIDVEVYNRIGPFDEGFYPGCFEDCDYNQRLRLTGVPKSRSLTEEHLVEHTQGSTFWSLPDCRNFYQRSQDRFVAKWGGMPDHETFSVPFNGGIDPAAPADEVATGRELFEVYEQLCKTPSDINEHLPTLCRLAKECGHVTEFGAGRSTIGLLMGEPADLVTYDVGYTELPYAAQALAEKHGKARLVYHQGDTHAVPIIEPTDLLFIDTVHTFEQIKAELDRHADRVRKYLVFHDTVTFGQTYHPTGGRGILPAIQEYFAAHPEWELAEEHSNNNGLMIWRRKEQQALPETPPTADEPAIVPAPAGDDLERRIEAILLRLLKKEPATVPATPVQPSRIPVAFVYPSDFRADAVSQWIDMLGQHAQRYKVRSVRAIGGAVESRFIFLVTSASHYTREKIDAEIASLRQGHHSFLVLHHNDHEQPTPGSYPSCVWTMAGRQRLETKYHAAFVRMPVMPAIFPPHTGPTNVGTFGHIEPKKRVLEMFQRCKDIGVPFVAHGPDTYQERCRSYHDLLRREGCRVEIHPWLGKLEECKWLLECSHFLFHLDSGKSKWDGREWSGYGGGSMSPRQATIFNRPVLVIDDEDTYRQDNFSVFADLKAVSAAWIKQAKLPRYDFGPDEYLDELAKLCRP